MKYSVAAVLVAVAGVSASYPVKNETVPVVTKVVESYVTYCPYPTEITHGDNTYTVTEPTTLTITDCPCTVTVPIITTSEVVCHDCPGYTNSTGIITVPTTTPIGTGEHTPTAEVPPTVPTAGAGKAAALSGAGLAGLVGLAAFVL